jgi:hypothetical protein
MIELTNSLRGKIEIRVSKSLTRSLKYSLFVQLNVQRRLEFFLI